MPEWIKDDGSFADDWRDKALPDGLQKEAALADIKDVSSLAKAFVETKKMVGQMAKLPADDAGKREFMTKHFGDIMAADAAKAKQDQEAAAAAAKTKADEDAAKAATKLQGDQKAAAEAVLGGSDTKAVDMNVEVARRAFRSDHCPSWAKAGMAKMFGVDSANLTDDQIKQAIRSDAALAETLLKIGKLTINGRMEAGDGGGGGQPDERTPAYPYRPDVYEKEPDTNPEKKYFLNRGAVYENGKYVGGFNATTRA